jgi:hypothetical protein
MLVPVEAVKVAISSGPGTVCGTQFSALFQSLLTGFELQVALPASAVWVKTTNVVAVNTD